MVFKLPAITSLVETPSNAESLSSRREGRLEFLLNTSWFELYFLRISGTYGIEIQVAILLSAVQYKKYAF